MYWLKRTIALLVLATMALVPFYGSAEASVYEGTIAIDCAGMDATDTGAHILDRDNTGSGEERIRILAQDGAGTVILDYEYQTALGTYAGGVGDWTWDTAPAYNPITVQIISMAGNGLPEQVDFTATGSCAGLPVFEGVAAATEPGCRALVSIPDHAVGGTVVAPAQLYATPGEPVVPETVLDPGQTARVLGVDSSGSYYQILWVCERVWVPVGTIGPNFDDVWNGTPLPTVVVD